MNAAFREEIAAGDDNRRDVFLTTARRLGTAVENAEKDFWVCWTLDALFNGLAAGTPRLLFNGMVLCTQHVREVADDAWMSDGWAPLPETSSGRYQCQRCSPDGTALASRKASDFQHQSVRRW
jgi:hypothetical protein